MSTVRLAQNLLLSVVSLLIFLGTAEGLARLRYRPERIRYDGIFEYDRDKVYALKRNLTAGTFVGIPVRTNSLGHRDREIPLAKPANGLRVVAIGDSVTFGHGVRAEQAWPERLERQIADRFPSLAVEVVNTAVPGNSPFQEYYDLERALVLEPDAVIIQFVLNDVVEPYNVFRRYGGRGKDYHGVEDLPYWDWQLSQRSAFYLMLRDWVGRMRFRTLTPDGVREGAIREEERLSSSAAADTPDDPVIQEAWRECLSWLQREIDLAKRHGLFVILLATPMELQFRDATRTYAQRQLAELAANNDIAWLDLLAPLNERARAEIGGPESSASDAFWRRYFLDYDHFTPTGHDFVAETLAPLLEPLAASRVGSAAP